MGVYGSAVLSVVRSTGPFYPEILEPFDALLGHPIVDVVVVEPNELSDLVVGNSAFGDGSSDETCGHTEMQCQLCDVHEFWFCRALWRRGTSMSLIRSRIRHVILRVRCWWSAPLRYCSTVWAVFLQAL